LNTTAFIVCDMISILALLSHTAMSSGTNLLFDRRNSSTFCSRGPEARSFGGGSSKTAAGSAASSHLLGSRVYRSSSLDRGVINTLHLLLDVGRTYTVIGTGLKLRKASQGARSVESTVAYRSMESAGDVRSVAWFRHHSVSKRLFLLPES